jgi:hypothetical protein
MTDPVRVFVDGNPLAVAAGTAVAAVIAGHDPELGAALADGRAYVTDGVGRPMAPAATVFAGAILRVVRSAPRSSAE